MRQSMVRWMAVAAVLVCGVNAGRTQSGSGGGMQGEMAEHHEHKVKVASSSLVVTVNGKSVTLQAADLAGMPQRMLTVHNAHSQVDETYTGVGLSELLAKYGLTTDGPGGAKQVYHSYVRAEGTDKYYVVYSGSELEPALHTGDAIVALMVDGKPLAEDGQFKMVLGGDKKPARWVTNLCRLTVVTVE